MPRSRSISATVRCSTVVHEFPSQRIQKRYMVFSRISGVINTAGKSKSKIAFVEDSRDTADLFTEFLDKFCDDFEVSYFPDGPAFLDTLQPGVYRIAIIDI